MSSRVQCGTNGGELARRNPHDQLGNLCWKAARYVDDLVAGIPAVLHIEANPVESQPGQASSHSRTGVITPHPAARTAESARTALICCHATHSGGLPLPKVVAISRSQELLAMRQCGAQPPIFGTELYLRCVNSMPGRHAERVDSSFRQKPIKFS